jgi:O-antigen ligase
MRGRSPFRGLVVLGSMAVLGVVVIGVAGASWDLFAFLLASAIFLACLCVTRALPGVAVARGKKAFLSATLVIWVFLMLSEIVFTHFQTAGSAASGHFDPSAYYQAASWILSFCALVVVSCLRPAYLRRLFTGPLKWASIFAVVAVLSCPLSTIPVYSAALAFKLCVIVLALCGIGEAVEDETGVFKLFSALFIGTLIVVVMEFAIPFLGPGPAFHGDRLGAMIGLSGTCGMLLLLSVLFLWLKKNPWFLVCGVFSVVIMMLAGTKGGIVASFVSLMMFFFLLKKPAQALAVSLAFSIIFALCVAFTPLGQSLQKYSESGNATTLTGRTNLWTAVWPEIEKRPLLGHGYRASRFVSEEVEGAFAEAGNMHNSFLEVLYNNGLAGLVPILVMSVLTVVNLWGVLLRPATLQIRYYAAAAFAFYTHLFVWGLISVTFGGAPDNRFMAFFAVLLISVLLKDQSNNKYGKPVYAEYNV